MTMNDLPWAPFEPTTTDAWDLRKVAHLHRRAGFGANWRDLQRDLGAGPAASVGRFFNPPARKAEEQRVLDGLRTSVLDTGDSERLKAWWLYRIVFDCDPLGEKLTLFWHNHFATSNRKVQRPSAMLQQNELLRRLGRAGFADLLLGIVADPAMLVWLDGGTNRRQQPNENFSREFLESFTLGTGNYTEADVRQAARAFTGYVPQPEDGFGGAKLRAQRREPPRFRFDPAGFDDGEKIILGQRGPWNAADIVRITLQQPAAATNLCRKLYRFLVREDSEPSAELIRPLAQELVNHQFSVCHVAGIILRSRHFYEPAVMRKRVKSPVEFSAGLVRILEMPRPSARLLALAAACDRQGQQLFYPPNVGGWEGGRTWLNSTTMLERGNWSSDVVWGNAQLGMSPFDPLAWAARNSIPAAQAARALVDLLLQGDLNDENRQPIVHAAADASADGLRRALQLLLHCPSFQLA
jgi:uncharacterized protein (DUF1800 family)